MTNLAQTAVIASTFELVETQKASQLQESYTASIAQANRNLHDIFSEAQSSTKGTTSDQKNSFPSAIDSVNLRRDVVRQSWSTDEIDGLATKRKNLVVKKFQNGLSARETKLLKYITWQLNRIDDSMMGEHLDRLESIAKAHERLARTVEEFATQVKQLVPKTSKHRGGRR